MTQYVDQFTWIERLEAALGTDKFPEVLRDLERDRNMKLSHVKWIAKRFAGGLMAKSKDDGYGIIYSRHRALMDAKAAADAIGGRTAA